MEILILTVLLLMIQTRTPVSASNCLGDDRCVMRVVRWEEIRSRTDVRKLHRLAKRKYAACCVFKLFSLVNSSSSAAGWDGCPAFLEQAKDDRIECTLFTVQGKDAERTD